MATRTGFLVCALIGVVAGCRSAGPIAPTGTQFHLTVDQQSVTAGAAGSPVHGLLHNDGSVSIEGYSFCSGSVELRTASGSWNAVWGWAFPCAALPTSLASGDSVSWQITLPANSSPGTYRIRFYGVPNYKDYSAADSRSVSPTFNIVTVSAARTY